MILKSNCCKLHLLGVSESFKCFDCCLCEILGKVLSFEALFQYCRETKSNVKSFDILDTMDLKYLRFSLLQYLKV